MSEQASDAIARRLAESTLALCAIPSVTGHERAIADELERRVRALRGVRVKRVGESVIAELGAPTVALFGHCDTVKQANDQPLAIEDERVFGCGASDMKGGLAVMLALLEDASRTPPAHGLRCVFYDREEGPAVESGILPLLEGEDDTLRGVTLALCLEPTDNRIEAGCVGGLHARVSFRGRRAHSARPWQGDNAIYRSIPLLERLRDHERRSVEIDGLVFYETMSATMASTESSRNVVPDVFTLNVNFRYAPGRSDADAIAELRAFVPGGVDVDIVDVAPAGAVRLDEPRLRAWIARRGLVTAAKQAWTDVARLSARGIAAVNFGPGASAEAHQARESIAVAALAAHHAALRDLLWEDA